MDQSRNAGAELNRLSNDAYANLFHVLEQSQRGEMPVFSYSNRYRMFSFLAKEATLASLESQNNPTDRLSLISDRAAQLAEDFLLEEDEQKKRQKMAAGLLKEI